MRSDISIGLVDRFIDTGGALGSGVTTGELADDNLTDFELVDDNGDIALLED